MCVSLLSYGVGVADVSMLDDKEFNEVVLYKRRRTREVAEGWRFRPLSGRLSLVDAVSGGPISADCRAAPPEE